MEKTLKSLLGKIAKIDPLRAGYLKRYIKFDLVSGGVVYTGNKSVINHVLSKAKISK